MYRIQSRINVSYHDVYSATAQLKQSIENEINAIELEYDQIQLSLDDLDSATNAFLQVAMLRNQRKALVAAETMLKMNTQPRRPCVQSHISARMGI